MDSTRTTEASPPYFRIEDASHWNRSSLAESLGSKYPEFPSGTVPYRWSFRQISTRWLARFVGRVNVNNSQPTDRLSRTVISSRCYVYNADKVKLSETVDWIVPGTRNTPRSMDLLAMRTCALLAESKRLREAIREASIGRVRPKLMTAATAIRGLLPILLLRMHGTEIERPLAIVMIGGLATSTIFILLVLQRFIRKLQTGRREWTAPHACYP